jgi:hypothetical protein
MERSGEPSRCSLGVSVRGGAIADSASHDLAPRGEQLARLMIRHAVLAIDHPRDFAIADGLMSYGGA